MWSQNFASSNWLAIFWPFHIFQNTLIFSVRVYPPIWRWQRVETLTGHKSCGSKEAPGGRRGKREGGEARLGSEGTGLATLRRLPAKVTRMKWLVVTFSDFFRPWLFDFQHLYLGELPKNGYFMVSCYQIYFWCVQKRDVFSTAGALVVITV